MSKASEARALLDAAEGLADDCNTSLNDDAVHVQRAIVYAIVGLARTIEARP